jgi:aspartyl-tRNA synthetase
LINDMRLEYVVLVEGTVRSRPNESVNKKMKTGFVEVCLLIQLSCILYILYVTLMCVVCCIR